MEKHDLLGRLDAFLGNLAEGHRKVTNDVVRYLQEEGRLESEIRKSVLSIGTIFEKWTFEILFLLRMRGQLRFNQLREELIGVNGESLTGKVKDLTGLSSRTLSNRLKELEYRGLVHREVFPEVPVRVEYSLTELGLRFGDLIMPAIAHLRVDEIKHPKVELD